MNRTNVKLYLFCALHPRGICHQILLANVVRTTLKTTGAKDTFKCWFFWELSSDFTPFCSFGDFTLEEHSQFHKGLPSRSDESTKLVSVKDQEVGQLSVPLAESHGALPCVSRSSLSAVFGIDCVFVLLTLDQALSQPNIFFKQEI